jgi:SIR2-like domain
MTEELRDSDWKRLLLRIKEKKCTPFLGAGASFGSLPLGGDLAEELAKRYRYPFADRDLVRIAQYGALHEDPNAPKEDVIQILRAAGPPKYRPPEFSVDGEPHGTLASLPLSVFVTTNYDHFMISALKWKQKDARQEICRWYQLLQKLPSVFDQELNYTPSPANPVVFHLHGSMDVSESLVLTEDDYLTFLASMTSNAQLLPPVIESAIATTTLLFIGYRLGDWNFRVMFQALRPRNQFSSVVVLKPPDKADPHMEAQQEYLKKYFAAMDMKLFWGTARQFCTELKQRWEASDPF